MMELENGVYYSDNLRESIDKYIWLDQNGINDNCCYTGDRTSLKADLEVLGYYIEDIIGIYEDVGRVYHIWNEDGCVDLIIPFE
ncbi:MAG: hypothetical protein AB3A66_30395 (plasmid) [Nodularia sp. CChRGM 3473]